jgi:hypothetical protein
VASSRVIPVRVGGVEIEVEVVPVAGTEQMVGRDRVSKAAGNVADAFGRAQETIIEVARSTAKMIDRAEAAARPDRMEVEFGLKFSVSGGVIMAGIAGEATLKVTLGYDVGARPIAVAAAELSPERRPDAGHAEDVGGSGDVGGPGDAGDVGSAGDAGVP